MEANILKDTISASSSLFLKVGFKIFEVQAAADSIIILATSSYQLNVLDLYTIFLCSKCSMEDCYFSLKIV